MIYLASYVQVHDAPTKSGVKPRIRQPGRSGRADRAGQARWMREFIPGFRDEFSHPSASGLVDPPTSGIHRPIRPIDPPDPGIHQPSGVTGRHPRNPPGQLAGPSQ